MNSVCFFFKQCTLLNNVRKTLKIQKVFFNVEKRDSKCTINTNNLNSSVALVHSSRLQLFHPQEGEKSTVNKTSSFCVSEEISKLLNQNKIMCCICFPRSSGRRCCFICLRWSVSHVLDTFFVLSSLIISPRIISREQIK